MTETMHPTGAIVQTVQQHTLTVIPVAQAVRLATDTAAYVFTSFGVSGDDPALDAVCRITGTLVDSAARQGAGQDCSIDITYFVGTDWLSVVVSDRFPHADDDVAAGHAEARAAETALAFGGTLTTVPQGGGPGRNVQVLLPRRG